MCYKICKAAYNNDRKVKKKFPKNAPPVQAVTSASPAT